jgi:hypothetical protein
MTTQPTLVQVIDLCGREAPYIAELSTLESDDVDHILDMWAGGNTAFVGELEYREVPDADAAAFLSATDEAAA